MSFNPKRFVEIAENVLIDSIGSDFVWKDMKLIEAISIALEIELEFELNNSGTEKPQQQKD